MENVREVSDRFSISPAQPEAEDFEALAISGYTAVVSVCESNELGQALAPEYEQELATAAGLAYCHIPLIADEINDSQVNEFRDWVSGIRGRILVHSGDDQRPAALTLMHIASEKGMSGKEALAQGDKLGIQWREDGLTQFMVHYVDIHSVDIHTV